MNQLKLIFVVLLFSQLLAQETRYTDDLLKNYQAEKYEELYDLADLALLELQKEDKAEAYLFKAVALYHFSKNAIQSIEYPGSLKKSVKQLVKFKKKDKSKRYTQKYQAELQELLRLMRLEVKRLEDKNQVVLANYVNKNLDYHFHYLDRTSQTPLLVEDELKVKELEKEKVSTAAPAKVDGVDEMLSYAQTKIGIPYQYGGTTDKGYDCSGYTANVYATRGMELPRRSADQATMGKKIDPKKAQPGDLLFFNKNGKINHVGIVLSNDKEGLKMIHASTSKGIRIDNVSQSDYWAPKLKFARRILE